MNLTGGGESAKELADAGSQEEAKTGNEATSPPRPPDRFFLVFWTFIAVTVAAIAGIVRWNFLPPGDRYFWPASADDWAAWGSWASAVGAIGAVYFASQSIKHTIEAQKGTERELKADREHDRYEREQERALVREEREALKKEIDQLALKEARQLSFKYHWGPPPPDSEYQVTMSTFFGPSMTVIPGPTEETVVAWSRGCPMVRGPSCTKGPLRNQSADRLLTGHHSAALPLTNS